jgi:YebC/PmpR family DNA-binding regulatory protein
MGRIFETRKATMFARYDRMAKAFTRIGKDIVIAVRAGGPDPAMNPQLRRVLQNAKAANMPKEKVEGAIKRAVGDVDIDYETVFYEGYAPHGVAVLVETATENPTRTVANIRTCFKKGGGSVGTSGSVAFLFSRMGVFRLKPEGIDQDELELELIDHGLVEMGEGEGEKGEPQLVIRCAFNDFGAMQAALEARKLEVVSSESEFIPATSVQLGEAEAEDVLKLIGRLEEDDDVQKVFHNLG